MGGSRDTFRVSGIYADRADVYLADRKYLIFVGFGDRFSSPKTVYCVSLRGGASVRRLWAKQSNIVLDVW